MNVAFQRNIGSFLRVAPGLASVTITAGSGNDGVAQDGIALDRHAFEPLILSGLFVLNVVTVLNDPIDTAEISCAFEDSADGVNWDDYDAGPGTSQAVTLETDGSHAVAFKAQFGGARRYVRAKPTANLSRANTDTATMVGVWVVGGADELPIADYVEPTES